MNLHPLHDKVRALIAIARQHLQAPEKAPMPPLPAPRDGLNVVVYHVPLPEGQETITAPDIKALDQSKYDYAAIIRHNRMVAGKTNPGARFWLYTDRTFMEGEPAIRNTWNASLPMFERIRAYRHFAMSKNFDAPTVFLDADAFLNADISALFKCDFDIAVTYRHDIGFMPINEGVIFAKPTDAARGFFDAYLRTYEALCDVPEITAHYGEIRRWRGGQLTLNALTCPHGLPSEMDTGRVFGIKIAYLPCSTFNFSMEPNEPLTMADLDAKAIIHLKGLRKGSLGELVRYHEQRFDDARRWSRDDTPPEDYEPETYRPHGGWLEIGDWFDHFKCDKGSIKHNYGRHYEEHFLDYSVVHLCEIGVACGSSLKAWSRYFGPKSKIVGIDIRPECAALCKKYPNIEIRIQDATKERIAGEFDVIIDDGSHVSEDILDTFALQWPALKPGGWYVIEDTRCTWSAAYRENSKLGLPPERFDRVHFLHLLDQILRGLDQGVEVSEVHCYREIVFIRKTRG